MLIVEEGVDIDTLSPGDVAEQLVLDLLWRHACLSVDEMTRLLPQLSWNTVFHTIDTLSRRGAILLVKQGFEYSVRLSPGFAHAGHSTSQTGPLHHSHFSTPSHPARMPL